jgi:hypothetical protein
MPADVTNRWRPGDSPLRRSQNNNSMSFKNILLIASLEFNFEKYKATGILIANGRIPF